MINRTLFLLFIGSAAAFSTQPLGSSTTRSSTLAPLFGGAAGVASSLEGKKTTVEAVKGLLEESEMVFTIPASSIKVGEMQKLRRSMPEGTTVRVVKNTLMERAVAGTEYEVATSLLSGANLWFFIEEDISSTIKAYNGFLKDCGKKDTHPLLGGVTEGVLYDTMGVEAIGKLPSKQELYAKIAASIKAVPTKVARVIKAPGNKLARAIKLAADEKSP